MCLDELCGQIRLQLFRLSALLEDVLTDKLAKDEFGHIIRLKTGFIPGRFIRLRQSKYLFRTANSSQTDDSSLK